MKQGNDAIISETQTFSQRFHFDFKEHHYDMVDEGKRFAAKYFEFINTYEDDVHISMNLEGILLPDILYQHEDQLKFSSPQLRWQQIF